MCIKLVLGGKGKKGDGRGYINLTRRVDDGLPNDALGVIGTGVGIQKHSEKPWTK